MSEDEFYSRVEHREDWSFSHLSRAETREATHSYHRYPAKFIPQLALALIVEYADEGDIVWDSFCGSGTLNVEAFRNNYHSIGTDINPVATLISRVKTTPLEPEALSSYKEELLEDIDACKLRSEKFYVARGILDENISLLDKWFPKDSLRELGHILWRIRLKKSKKKYREFALCAFSSILKRSSYWLSSSIKFQIDPDRKPEKPSFYFRRQLIAMEAANKPFHHENEDNQTQVRIFKRDAKHSLPKNMPKIGCIITSPPYIVSYDYSEIFRLSTYFLFPQSNYDQFRRRFIGTKLRRDGRRCSEAFSSVQPIVESIRDAGIKRALPEYYRDMRIYFENARNHLKENGCLVMIVGDTKLRGVEIPNAHLLTEIAKETEWSLEKAYSREIPLKILPTLRDQTNGRFTTRANRNHLERYNREHILVFRRQTT